MGFQICVCVCVTWKIVPECCCFRRFSLKQNTLPASLMQMKKFSKKYVSLSMSYEPRITHNLWMWFYQFWRRHDIYNKLYVVIIQNIPSIFSYGIFTRKFIFECVICVSIHFWCRCYRMRLDTSSCVFEMFVVNFHRRDNVLRNTHTYRLHASPRTGKE